VPLTSLAALQKVWIERDRYFELIKSTAAQAILVFCPETRHPQAQLSVRVFAEALGIPEDPATGSASGCLAAYLSYHRYFGTQAVDVLVEQGYEVGRPSQLYLRANRQLQGIEVSVGGQVIPVAQGQLL
jgi:trans-2,3-dihydro-3-hydroxyanthranilate isomerase